MAQLCNLTLEGSPRYRSGSCAICTGPSSRIIIRVDLFLVGLLMTSSGGVTVAGRE